MKTFSKILTLISCFFITISLAGNEGKMDLSTNRGLLDAYAKIRGDNSGKDVFYHWTGSIYSSEPGKPYKFLFKCEGFSVSRIIKENDGWFMFSRENFFYLDPVTGKLLETWINPLTGKKVEIIHVWNDPVNVPMKYSFNFNNPRSPYKVSVTDLGDTLALNVDALLFYPSPLKRTEYPLHSQSNMYRGAEFFQFYSPKKAVMDNNRSSVPALISWTRVSQWLPFMEMADRPGNLIYHCRGKKLANGFDDLPGYIKNLIEKEHPEYKHAPNDDSRKKQNETSWTYFYKKLQKKRRTLEKK